MARKKLVENELGLEQLIPQYAVNNQECNKYKKIVKEQGDQIKRFMREDKSLLKADGKRIKVAGGYEATVSIRPNESWDEDKLLAIIKEQADKKVQKEIVRKKEYVDADALEKLIYNNGISKELLLMIDSCRIQKPTEVLTIKKEESDGGKES